MWRRRVSKFYALDSVRCGCLTRTWELQVRSMSLKLVLDPSQGLLIEHRGSLEAVGAVGAVGAVPWGRGVVRAVGRGLQQEEGRTCIEEKGSERREEQEKKWTAIVVTWGFAKGIGF